MQTGTQKAQLGIVGNLSYQFTPSQRISLENFYTHSGRDEGRFFQGDNLDNAREYQNNRLQFIEEGLMSNAIGGEHFFQSAVEQPARLARELRARDARRTGPARDAVRAPARQRGDRPVHLRGRVAERLPHVQRAQRRHRGRGRQLEHLQRRGRTADAVQVRRQLRRAHARLPVAPVPLHSDHDAESGHGQPALQPPAPARGVVRARATSARRSGSTRRRGRWTPTTASRRRPPATAWSTSPCRAARG